jgi:hypothetical protein
MQTAGTYSTMRRFKRLSTGLVLIGALLAGCVSHVYKPGVSDNPFNQIKLSQTYSEMVKILGEPDHSYSENRMGKEVAIAFVPLWNIAEWIGDFNPSAMQIYTYDRWGAITIDNNNHVIRVEAK